MGRVKLLVMDKLREQHPEKFNESGAMDYTWFEKDVRPNYNCFVRLDVKSVSFSFDVELAPIGIPEVASFLADFSFDRYV